MAIFNSQPINTDPKPWVAWDVRYSDRRGTAYSDPRPEFDNNPNPLIVAYRECHDGDMRGWGMWLVFAHEAMEAQGLVTDDHYQHAKNVLKRLARQQVLREGGAL